LSGWQLQLWLFIVGGEKGGEEKLELRCEREVTLLFTAESYLLLVMRDEKFIIVHIYKLIWF
jgi:hypothetical protein